eukprot:scaffold5931_cov94-Isochrysis_galbana.AAC.2
MYLAEGFASQGGGGGSRAPPSHSTGEARPAASRRPYTRYHSVMRVPMRGGERHPVSVPQPPHCAGRARADITRAAALPISGSAGGAAHRPGRRGHSEVVETGQSGGGASAGEGLVVRNVDRHVTRHVSVGLPAPLLAERALAV